MRSNLKNSPRKRDAKKLRDLDTKRKKQFIASNLKRLGSATRGCRLVGMPRSTYYYKPKGKKPLTWSFPKR